MTIREELNNRNDAIRNAFVHGDKDDLNRAGRELMQCLISALDAGKAEEDDGDSIRFAIWECIGKYGLLDNDVKEANTDEIVGRVIELVNNRSVDKTTKMIWIKSLIRVLHRTDVKRMEENTTVSYFNRFYLPAMEQEADEFPSPELMKWYEVFLEKEPGYRVESSMYNRLAYYWLHGYCRPQEYKDRAEAYFKAMERRGIKAENPYTGYYGRSNHAELVKALLDGEFESQERSYWNEMVSGIVKEMIGGTAEDNDLDEFREIMYKMHLDNMYGASGLDADAWNQTIRECGDALAECCAKAEQDEKYTRAARAIAVSLAEYDNWLLKYIELKNEGITEEAYYELVEDWLIRLEKVADDSTWVMISSLQGILIDRYYKTGETEKLIKLLKKQTGGIDVASYLTGENYEGYRKRYCTSNTMALIKLLINNGNRNEADSIVKEISESAEAVENGLLFGKDDKTTNLWIKYINLLEEYGYENEAAEWRDKLRTCLEKSNSEIECELCYINGDYEEALRISKNNTDQIETVITEMLEYIIYEKLPQGIDPDKVICYDLKPADAVHCRGSITTDELQREIQMTNEEWHRCSATMGELAKIFACGLREGEQPVMYPKEYYTIPCEYAPDIPIMRGDYIRHLYKGNDGRSWLGLTKKDVRQIETELKKNS